MKRSDMTTAVRFHEGGREELSVPVTREAPLTIIYNGREIITLLASPDHLRELAVGFLRSEGFLGEPRDLLAVEVDEAAGTASVKGRADAALVSRLLEKRTVTSGCGKGTTFYHALDALQSAPTTGDWRIPLGRIVELAAEINKRAADEREAGGVHHAALAGDGGIAVIREDIGRHNAIDKIQGHCFLNGTGTADKFLLSTGRISSEIVIKAGKLGVPILVSLSKPSSLALELAQRLKLTVIGNLRGRRGLIYNDFGRIE